MDTIKKKHVWFFPALAILLGILALSTFIVAPIHIEEVEFEDKIEHFFAYAVLTTSFLFAFFKAKKLTKAWAWGIVIFASLYGLLIEWIQFTFFPHRFFEWTDALANVIGVVLGRFVFWLIYRV